MTEAGNAGADAAVAVLGAGIMGRGIALVAAQTGHSVLLIEQSPSALEDALAYARRELNHPKSPYHERSTEVLGRIRLATDLDSLRSADAIVEAVPEDLALKRRLLADVERAARPDALLTTNTSALSVSAIASSLDDPSRLVGTHFFNPVPRMHLIEIVVGLASTPSVVTRAETFARALGKRSVRVADRPGFVTSRINVLIGNEAFHLLTEGVASAEDIDLAIRLGLNHPMGPFELADLVGLDTRIAVLRSLAEAYGERFRPDPSLVALVEAGRLGRKTGRGVFRYDETGRRIDGEGEGEGARP